MPHLSHAAKCLFLAGLALLGARAALAQPCGQAVPLNPAIGFDRTVAAQAVFDEDGAGPNPSRLFACGSFTHAGGIPANKVARWDGQNWSAVGAGVPFTLARSMRVFDDGRGLALFVGGYLNGPVPQLSRWDGSQWTQVPLPAFGANTVGTGVAAMVVYDPDGPGPLPLCLHIAATYYEDAGCPRTIVYRYDGQTFTPLGQPLSTDFIVDLLPFDPDGPAGPAGYELYLIGRITTSHSLCGDMGPYLYRLTGNTWTLLSHGSTTDEYDALAVFDPDEGGPTPPRLYMGGTFQSISGVAAKSVAAWDGSSFAAADAGLHTDLRGVLALSSFDADGSGPGRRVLTAVEQRAPSGQTSIGSLMMFDGSTWSPMGVTVTGSFNSGSIFNLREFDADGTGPIVPVLSLIGYFDGVNALAAQQWIGIHGTAVVGPSIGPGGAVNALSIFNDGSGRKLFAAGQFGTVGEISAASIARWDGATWSALGQGIAPTPAILSPVVHALAAHNDGSGWALYAAGLFGSAGGQPASDIARWNGSAWSRVGASGLAGGEVLALEVFDPDGAGPLPAHLFAGGSFSSADGKPAWGLAEWDGSAWSAVGGGVTGTIRALKSFDDGTGPALYVGGDAFSSTGLPLNRAARWRAGHWESLPMIGDGTVQAFGIHDEGSGYGLYAAGPMAWGSGNLRSIGRLMSDHWQPLASVGPSSPRVLRSVIESGVPVLYAGSDDGALPLARYAHGAWSAVTPTIVAPILAISPAFDDGAGNAVFAAGPFIAVGSDAAGRIARIPVCTCYANCDGSTTAPILNIADFVCFLNEFAAADPRANCDSSTTPPVLNVADFVCFLNEFAAGCP